MVVAIRNFQPDRIAQEELSEHGLRLQNLKIALFIDLSLPFEWSFDTFYPARNSRIEASNSIQSPFGSPPACEERSSRDERRLAGKQGLKF